MRRIFLLVLTNIAMMVTLSIVTQIVCVLLGTSVSELIGPEYATLAVFAFVYGFVGAFLSLLLSKTMAKVFCRAKVIDGTEGETEHWLVATVGELARAANINMPEVAIYPGAANAFATGAFRNHALVAVSTDILGQMTKEELRAVLGHEMSHIANGDMVTMTLLQGVLNACVLFFSRALASILANAGKGDRESRGSNGGVYFLVVIVLQIALGLLSSLVVCAYSRRREYAADSGSARLLGSPAPMIAALRRLANLQPGILPDSLKAFGIAEGRRTSLWATHPSLDDRIAALEGIVR